MFSPLLRLRATFALLIGSLLFLGACVDQNANVLGEAYVAPATLNLRHDLSQKNATVAVLKYGERVGIVDIRRRFIKIRTSKGQEGWVDSSQLLSPEQMDQIRKDTQKAMGLPSEGAAGVFEALNVHLEPSRLSPAFTRIPDGGSVAVLAYKLEPKTAAPSLTSPTFIKPQQASRRQRKEKQVKSAALRLPKPAAPKPPANWQELSAERIDGAESTADIKVTQTKAAQAKLQEAMKPVVLESWALVHTKENQIGWVLSRNLVMSIPDEVAQYAEGKHITSYFDLGTINDEEKGPKHNWLWTTAISRQSSDFDGWRVFLWNRHRHRYETSYRERDVEGYFPVSVDPVDSGTLARTFHLLVKEDDGKLWNKSYLFDGTRVHLTVKEESRPGADADKNRANGLNYDQMQAKLPQPGWLRRQWNSVLSRFRGKQDGERE